MNNSAGKVEIGFVIGVVVAAAIIGGVVSVVMWDTTGAGGSGLGRDFDYDVSAFAKVEPELVSYRQIESFATGFAESRAIAVGGDGDIYVAGDESIAIYDSAGNRKNELPLGGEPRCIAVGHGVGSGSRLYVGMAEHVEVYDVRGSERARWRSLGDRAVITNIAVGSDAGSDAGVGDVFVADAGNRVVVRYDKSGRIVNYIGRKDDEKDVEGFFVPSANFDLAIALDGLLRVVDPGRHLIIAFTFDGERRFWWGGGGNRVEEFCGCCNPVNIAILPDGGIVTVEKGLVRVKVYDADGGFAGVVAGHEQLVDNIHQAHPAVFDVAVGGAVDGAAGGAVRIYVLDTIKNVVRVFVKKDSTK